MRQTLSELPTAFHSRKREVLTAEEARKNRVDVPPLSTGLGTYVRRNRPTHPHHQPTTEPVVCEVWLMLLRKEVIQPHLPVRLPCYDFVPIASPTFDSSPPYGLGHRLRVLPTFMT